MANLIGYEEKSVHLLTEPKKVSAVYLVKKLESKECVPLRGKLVQGMEIINVTLDDETTGSSRGLEW